MNTCPNKHMYLLEALPQFIAKLQAYNVTYQRVLGDLNKGNWTYATGHWQTKYGTSSFEEAQRKAAKDLISGGPAGARLKPHLEATHPGYGGCSIKARLVGLA